MILPNFLVAQTPADAINASTNLIGQLLSQLQQLFTKFGLDILAALLIIIIGIQLSKFLQELVRKLLIKSSVDRTLTSFVGNITYYVAFTFVIIAALGQIGIQTTSIIALLGAAGLAVGLAVQGSLSNFASGVLIIIFRPFVVDDIITAGGASGKVVEISIFTTKLLTYQNETIIVPNTKIYSDNIINYSQLGTRRVDMIISVAYGSDLEKVKAILLDILQQDERILKDPAPVVGTAFLGEGRIDMTVRPWVNNSSFTDCDFSPLMGSIYEQAKARFEAEGIILAIPTTNVNLRQN